MFDAEYLVFPKRGSRVQTKDGRYGTVVKHRKQSTYLTQCEYADYNQMRVFFHDLGLFTIFTLYLFSDWVKKQFDDKAK